MRGAASVSECVLKTLALGSAPPRTGSPGPFPRKSPKRVPNESPEQDPQSAERVRSGVSKESEKCPKVRPFSDSFETLWRTLSGLGDSFETLFGLFRGSGPEGPGRPCAGRGPSKGERMRGSSTCDTYL